MACVIMLATYTSLAESALIFRCAGNAAAFMFKYVMRNFKRHSLD